MNRRKKCSGNDDSGLCWQWLCRLGLTLAAVLLLVRPVAASSLWQLEKDGRTHYLLGTIHVSDPEIVNLPPHVAQAVQSSRRLVVEVISDAVSQRRATARALLASNTLDKMLDKALFEDVASAARLRGVTPERLVRMKPWAVALMLNFPMPAREPVLDVALQYRFQDSERPVHALETLDEQLDIFDRLPLSGQIAFLELSLAQAADFDAYMDFMKSLYLQGDLEAILRHAQALMDNTHNPLMADLMYRMLDERNLRMFDRLQSHLEETGTFIAVGALHLPGWQGLLQLFRQAGYTVRPVVP